jgi:hypothetical protein
VEGTALRWGELVEEAGLGKDVVGVEVGPGFDCGFAVVDVCEEGGGVGFDCESACSQEVEGVSCAEEVWFCHIDGCGQGVFVYLFADYRSSNLAEAL